MVEGEVVHAKVKFRIIEQKYRPNLRRREVMYGDGQIDSFWTQMLLPTASSFISLRSLVGGHMRCYLSHNFASFCNRRGEESIVSCIALLQTQMKTHPLATCINYLDISYRIRPSNPCEPVIPRCSIKFW